MAREEARKRGREREEKEERCNKNFCVFMTERKKGRKKKKEKTEKEKEMRKGVDYFERILNSNR